MVKLSCEIEFVTPAFLGRANPQYAQWRTPPFKALLRRWWRIVETSGKKPKTTQIREKEGSLFGNAGESASASQVRLRIDWRGEIANRKKWKYSFEPNLIHPEVSVKVGSALYLGYGPVGVGNVLNREQFIAPGISRKLFICAPEEEKNRLKDTIRLIHLFGGVGSRSRNGWGSVNFKTGGISIEDLEKILDPHQSTARNWLRSYARSWVDALDTNWCHALGKDEEERLLLWRTEEKTKFEEVLDVLAKVKIAFRTKFHFKGGGQHRALCERHVLAYPVTRHELINKKLDRSANQIIFKVLPLNGKFIGLIAHLPHGLYLEDSGVNEKNVWTTVHAMLDGTSKITWGSTNFQTQSVSALGELKRLP